jgi:hypothetical protein
LNPVYGDKNLILSIYQSHIFLPCEAKSIQNTSRLTAIFIFSLSRIVLDKPRRNRIILVARSEYFRILEKVENKYSHEQKQKT